MEWDGEQCQSCGRGYSDVWAVPDELWLRVVGKPGGLRCTDCFTREAAALGIHVCLSPPDYVEEAVIPVSELTEARIRERINDIRKRFGKNDPNYPLQYFSLAAKELADEVEPLLAELTRLQAVERAARRIVDSQQGWLGEFNTPDAGQKPDSYTIPMVYFEDLKAALQRGEGGGNDE